MSAAGSLVEAILDVRDHWRHLQRAQRMAHWVEVPAEVVLSEVRFTPEGVATTRGHRLDGWAANVVCRYRRGVDVETAMRPVADEPPMYADKADAQRAIAAYPQGASVRVWVNPDNPHDAVFHKLEAGDSLNKVIGAGFIALFVAGVLFFYFARPFFRAG